MSPLLWTEEISGNSADSSRIACADLSFNSKPISTGVYGYPIHLAAPVAIRAAKEHLARGRQPEHVLFVLLDKVTYDAFAGAA